MAFSKLKSWLRKAAERTLPSLGPSMAHSLDAFSQHERQNDFSAAGCACSFNGKCSSVVGELSRIISDDQTEEEILNICNLIVTENISRRGLEDLVRRTLSKEDGRRSYNKRKQTEIHVPIKRGKEAIGSFRTFDNGGIEFKIQPQAEIDESSRTKLIYLLEALAEAACESDQEEMVSSILERLNEFK